MMKFLVKLISKLHFAIFSVRASNVFGTKSDFKTISTGLFTNDRLINEINKDLIVSIISNNFIADPSNLITRYKANYDFTVNEFYVLMFKIGMLTKVYIDDSTKLLQEALYLKDVFSKEELSKLEGLLKVQEDVKDDNLLHNYEQFKLKQEKLEASIEIDEEETDPDKLIDNWLAKRDRERKNDL